MKKTLFTLALVAASFAASAQNSPAAPSTATTQPTDAYSQLLAATIQELMSTGDPAQLKQVDAKLERAASVKPQDWLPRYYQAYARVVTCFVSKEDGDAKDKYLDQAETALAQARKLGGDESELLVLEAYLGQGRLMVSPMTRFATYGSQVAAALSKAKKLNPANPRLYLVQGNNVYHTPEMFGGGAGAAKLLYDEANARFAVFKPASALAPNWGERQLKARLASYASAPVQAAAK
ncbi:hypothetical protein [Hymenobacter guriensis]|uniref:DUF4919 domain-containing protein n=1 Tax=Hymenobacter guriensis TaxID=2793065 RepID=A0ABS0L8A5_9BACT|nr:hypothetical protein [Hymenobacter guriensis]MBG8555629.1 hypothetical protein [Hymenobacter guriensis]